jgi:aryl-alcohol dehydrogenase-like predicted oxidoreductase
MLAAAREREFRFDTVQMPLNIMDAHFASFEKKVLPELVSAGIGVLGMKSMGDHEILNSGVATATECLHYAMNLPTSVVITGCDSLPILEQALKAARTFKPLTDAERDALLAKSAPLAGIGKYELYKTSQRFDGTAQNPHWLG